jgi:aminoglycoside 3-N-acetyltransferase
MERRMTSFGDFVAALNKLEIPDDTPIIAHASLSAFGQVEGGAEALLGALMVVYRTLIMPGFTYRTMIIPENGPPGNGIPYGKGQETNRRALIYQPDMPVDRLMGVVPEALRLHPLASRSHHPILSFLGVHAESILASQSIERPLNPVGRLLERGGWVLLLGVDQEVNTSIHYAEFLAGRKQFIRWALTENGVRECPGFPGCSDGFGAINPRLMNVIRQESVGSGMIKAYPLGNLITAVRSRLEEDPLALLCDRTYCERCQAVRQHFRDFPSGQVSPYN